MMRKLIIVTALLLAAAAARSYAAQRPLSLPRPHGPPDLPNTFVCKVLPRYGGGICTTVPYPHLGARCTCEGARGPRVGMVSTR